MKIELILNVNSKCVIGITMSGALLELVNCKLAKIKKVYNDDQN